MSGHQKKNIGDCLPPPFAFWVCLTLATAWLDGSFPQQTLIKHIHTMTGELWNSSINCTSQLAIQDRHHHHNCSHPIELADATGNGDYCCFRQAMVIAGVFQAVLWSLKESQWKSIGKKQQQWCVWTTSDTAFAVTDDLSDVKYDGNFRPHLLTVLPLQGSLLRCASLFLVLELGSGAPSVSLPVPSQFLPSFFSAVLWCCYSPRFCLSTSMISLSINLKALALVHGILFDV